MIAAAFAVVITSFAPALAQNASAWSAPRTVYFQETGHSLDQLFLDHWRSNGGQSNYGLPITEEIEQDNGVIVQYLEYARFEYWPEGNENGDRFVIGKVGEDLRPSVLQRSMIASQENPGDVAGISDQVKAWLPVQQDSPRATAVGRTYVEETKHTIGDGFLEFWTNTGEASYLGNPLSEEYTIGDDSFQVFEYGQLTWTAENGVQMVPVGGVLAEKYDISTEASAQGDIPTYDESLFVEPEPEPEDTTAAYVPGGGEVWVNINLSAQYMTIYQGNTELLGLYISSGKDGWETPTGTFYINSMIPLHDMVGETASESWYVPDVPWAMYFTNNGHAIHGTYWHDNYGTRLSHGCINMPVWAAEYLYSMAFIGMRVQIHY